MTTNKQHQFFLIAYKILNGQSTSYLEPIIQEYHPSRTLRSSTRSLLCIPSIKSNLYGGRAFSATVPKLWNSIPEYIKRAETVKTLLLIISFLCFILMNDPLLGALRLEMRPISTYLLLLLLLLLLKGSTAVSCLNGQNLVFYPQTKKIEPHCTEQYFIFNKQHHRKVLLETFRLIVTLGFYPQPQHSVWAEGVTHRVWPTHWVWPTASAFYMSRGCKRGEFLSCNLTFF